MTAVRLALSVDARQYSSRVEVHDDSLVEELVDDEDNSAHVVDKGFALDLVAENAVKALVDAVEDEAEDQLVVLTVPNDEDGHV